MERSSIVPGEALEVLLVGASDLRGGAARAAYRLHRGLSSRKEVRSRFLVQHKDSDDPSVLGPSSPLSRLTSKVRRATGEALSNLLPGEASGKRSLNIVPSGLHRRINALDPDVVHLHWIGHESISIREVRKIEAPIVWTLHDMWAFRGFSHYLPMNKKGGENEESAGKISFSIDRWLRRYKKQQWSDVNMTIVTPSAWLAQRTRRSEVLGQKRIRQIFNGIDTDTYKPISTSVARSVFQLPEEVPLVLFGAINPMGNSRKGGHLLQPALRKLQDHRDDIELVVFGGADGNLQDQFEATVHPVGRLQDDCSLALLYSAADVFAIPSMQDNLPNTVVEAMASGTPCVGFDVGGIPEMIDHRKNGYVAERFSVEDFAEGLRWVIESEVQSGLRREARAKVQQEFELDTITQRYLECYRDARK